MVEYIPAVSKAFTRESDDASTDEIAPARAQVSGRARSYVTREGADRLRNRLEELLEQRRVLVDESSKGDTNAKAVLRNVDLAIQKLQSTLNSVIIAEPPADQTGITLGASVRVRDENGEEETYQIVGIDEADPSNGRISSVSPLAKALLTRRAGEKVRFQSPAGSQELTILSVQY